MAWVRAQGYQLCSGLLTGEARDEALLLERPASGLEAVNEQRTRGWLLRESH